jgi:hypothetical protein
MQQWQVDAYLQDRNGDFNLNVQVTLWRRRSGLMTGWGGDFTLPSSRLPDVPPGEYQVRIEDREYQIQVTNIPALAGGRAEFLGQGDGPPSAG